MKKIWIPAIMLILVLLAACSSPEQALDQPEDGVGSAEILSENEGSSQADSDAGKNESSSPPTDVPADVPTDVPAEDSSEDPEVVHGEIPGDFKQTPLQNIFDCTTGPYFNPGQEYALSKVCDQWERNYFERPVDEESLVFFPQLDIVESSFGQDENWYYTRILLFSELVDNLVLDGVYALEIDLNLDARGDILVLAAAPGRFPAGEWHSNGVQVWFDSNDDVGGPQAVLADPLYNGDGYETLLVDNGRGDDPDLAFVKTYGDKPGLVEFGFKASLLGGVDSFEWWVWAMREDVSAAKYDPVDFFPQDTLFAIDNTCGWIYGSYRRDLPNICDIVIGPISTPKPGATSPSCPPSTAKDTCAGNGGDWEDYPWCQCVIN